MQRFKTRVYGAVKRIPPGTVLSYKEVARRAGFPRVWRAVGNILNQNCNSVIPCHRVIKSDGTVGGYRRGQKRKIELLKKEGVRIENKKIVS